MAMVEGECLENLDRYAEAVELYWLAAMQLREGAPPLAMRRLVDLYSALGQLPVLETAVAREATLFPVQFRRSFLGRADAELGADGQKLLEQQLAYSSIPAFERVRHFRKAARERRWEVLLLALQLKTDERYENALEHEILSWKRREAISALMSVSVEAVPILEGGLLRDAANPYLQAALLACRATDQQHPEVAGNDNSNQSWEIARTLQGVTGNEATPARFRKPPVTLRLPTQLTPVFKTSE
jgi:hypothetical protein